MGSDIRFQNLTIRVLDSPVRCTMWSLCTTRNQETVCPPQGESIMTWMVPGKVPPSLVQDILNRLSDRDLKILLFSENPGRLDSAVTPPDQGNAQ